jgi:hypothetical protein
VEPVSEPLGERSIFDASPEDAYVVIQRHEPGKGWVTMAGRLAPAQVTEEMIADHAGGGKYKLIEKVPAPNGSYTFGRIRTIYITGPDRPFRGWPTYGAPQVPERMGTTAQAPAAAVGGGGSVMQLLETGLANKLIDVVNADKRDPMAALAPILEEMRKDRELLREVLLNRADSRSSVLSELKAMRDIVAPPTPPPSSVTEIVAGIRALKGASEEFAPPPPPERDPLAESLPRIVDVITTEQQLKRQALLQGTRPPTPPPPLPSGEAPVSRLPADSPLWQRVLEAEGGRLVEAATNHRDPATMAQLAVTFAPPEVQEAMGVLLGLEDSEQQVVAIVPAMAAYPEWLTLFLDALEDVLSPDDDQDVPEGPPPGPELVH